MEIGHIIVLILVIFGILSIIKGSIGEAFGLVVMLSGIVMVIGGFIYGIYVAVTTKAFSYSIFDTFKYWRMYGKEILTSHALFYGGIILAIIGEYIKE